ncbi:Gfo/Idh/MocA family protein [Sphingorhabdus sp.]|uniref:Gfo/Idh/MocA family protein n=1 Tax=Sphingorhabdus sp. TaxID=1902408 RepID=UPI003BAF7286
MTAPVKIGIIGLGRMGQNHLRVLSLLAAADLRFIYDLDAENVARLSASSGVPAASDLEAALAGVDAVVIASPTTTHADYIALAAKHVKNIFVEKPITEKLDSSLTIAKMAKEHGLNLQVGLIERFNPAVEQMKRLLDRSEQVVSVDFVRTNKISARITDVDVVTDLMIHDIDLALYLNGPVTAVSAHGVAEGPMIDYAAALLTHENGRFSRIQASRITDKKMRSIQATCKDMFVDCELLRKEITLSRQSEVEQRPGEPYRISAVEEKIEVVPREALQLELQAFLASCNGEHDPGIPGAEAGVAAMAVCEQILTAILGESA